MQMHLFRDGQQHGPYTLEQMQAMATQGQLLPADLATYEGASGWMPVQQAIEQAQGGGFEKYNRFSETVGGVSLRWKDNLIQLVAVIGGICVGALVGFLMHETMQSVMIGAGIGMVGTLLLSGAILGVLRLFKKGD